MGIEITQLPSGIRVATEFMPHVETIAAGVWFGVGTRNERPDQNGIAHLLEHMMFKGTARRNAQRISEEIESVGGHTNAYTGRDVTAYYARAMHGDLPLVVDLLCDLIQFSTFDPVELAREQQVIIQEIHQSNDTPDDVISDYLQEAAYGKQPMGYSILGRPGIIEKLTPDDLRAYVQNHYTAKSTVVSAAGRIDHKQFCDLVQNHLTHLPTHRNSVPVESRFLPDKVLMPRDVEQSHLALAFPAAGTLDADYFAHSVYATLLGGSASSRLWQEVREKRGLVYGISANLLSVDDGGILAIHAGVAPQKIVELKTVIRDQILNTAENITGDELIRAKQQLKAGMFMSLEQTFSRAEQTAQHLLTYNRVMSVDEIASQIDKVDKSDIIRVVSEMIRIPPALAAIGIPRSLDAWSDFGLKAA